MTWFGRSKKLSPRDKHIDDVVEAWNNVEHQHKPELILKHPDLYFAVARMATYEKIRKGARND